MLSACSANPQSSEAASSLSSESEASQTSISSSVSEEEFTIKIQSFVGGWTTQNDSAVSKSSNNLGVVTNHTLSKGLIRLRMSANGKGDSGIIFGSEAMPTAYYSFFVTTSGGNQIKLMKKTGEGNQELRSCYITAGYSETANVELAVEFDQGDIKCFLNGSMLLSYKDEEPLTGDRFGFMSKNAGSLFDDITIEDQGMFKPVDTLIIGHSYMELWSDYKNDLDRYPDIANIGIGGTAGDEWKDYVTGQVTEKEAPVLAEAIRQAAAAIDCIITDGIDIAMNRFNTSKKKEKEDKKEDKQEEKHDDD